MSCLASFNSLNMAYSAGNTFLLLVSVVILSSPSRQKEVTAVEQDTISLCKRDATAISTNVIIKNTDGLLKHASVFSDPSLASHEATWSAKGSSSAHGTMQLTQPMKTRPRRGARVLLKHCYCFIEAGDPDTSYMAVQVKFQRQTAASSLGLNADNRTDPDGNNVTVTACPKLYLVYNERTRQELRCLGFQNDQETVYRLPPLRLKTLSIHLEMESKESHISYAGVVVNVTSTGDGVLRTNCNVNNMHHSTTTLVPSTSTLPASRVSGSPSPSPSPPVASSSTTSSSPASASSSFPSSSSPRPKTTTTPTVDPEIGHAHYGRPSDPNTTPMASDATHDVIATDGTHQDHVASHSTLGLGHVTTARGNNNGDSNHSGLHRPTAGGIIGIGGGQKDDDDDGGVDDDDDSSRTVLISVLTVGVLLAFIVGLVLYLRRWWRQNNASKSRHLSRRPIPYCVTLIADVLSRNSSSSSTPTSGCAPHEKPEERQAGKAKDGGVDRKPRKQNRQRKSENSVNSDAHALSDYLSPMPNERDKFNRGRRNHGQFFQPITSVAEIHSQSSDFDIDMNETYCNIERAASINREHFNRHEKRAREMECYSNGPVKNWKTARAFLSGLVTSSRSDGKGRKKAETNVDVNDGRCLTQVDGDKMNTDAISDSYEMYVPNRTPSYDKGSEPQVPTSVYHGIQNRGYNDDTPSYEVAKVCFENQDDSIDGRRVTQIPGYTVVDKENRRINETLEDIKTDAHKVVLGQSSTREDIGKQKHERHGDNANKQPPVLPRVTGKQNSKISSPSSSDITHDEKQRSYNSIISNANISDFTRDNPTFGDQKYESIVNKTVPKRNFDESFKNSNDHYRKPVRDDGHIFKMLRRKRSLRKSKSDSDSDGTIIRIMKGDKIESIKLSPYLNPKPLSTPPPNPTYSFETHKYDYPDILIPNAYGQPHGGIRKIEFIDRRNGPRSLSNSFASVTDSESSDDGNYDNEEDKHNTPPFHRLRFTENEAFVRNNNSRPGSTIAQGVIASSKNSGGSSKTPMPKPRLKSKKSPQIYLTDSCEIQFSDDECSRESVDV